MFFFISLYFASSSFSSLEFWRFEHGFVLFFVTRFQILFVIDLRTYRQLMVTCIHTTRVILSQNWLAMISRWVYYTILRMRPTFFLFGLGWCVTIKLLVSEKKMHLTLAPLELYYLKLLTNGEIIESYFVLFKGKDCSF